MSKTTTAPPRRRRPALLALCTFVSLLALACQQQATEQTAANAPAELPRERVTGTPGGTLTYRVIQPIKTLNPLMFTDEATFTVAVHLLQSRLLDFDHDQQGYVAGLAESWQLGEDGRTMEVVLRDGLKFSDGRPLTTEDIAFTLRAMYDERVKSLYRSQMMFGDKKIEAVVADARRMRLVFPEPVGAPEGYLVNLFALPRHVLEEDLKRGTLGTESYSMTGDPAKVVTAGPFVVESAVPGERVVLRRNPNYWKRDAAGNQLPYLERLVVEAVQDSNAAVTRLTEGGFDIVDRLRASDYAALRGGQGQVRAYDLGPGLITDYIIFNQNPTAKSLNPAKLAWFRDVRFRRAVSHAVDRQTLASSTLQGLATPLYGFVSPGNRAWAAADLPRFEYDLNRSRELLREAGFETRGAADAPELFDREGNRVEFTLILSATSDERKAIAAVLQEDLARLGIRMQVVPIATSEVAARTLQSFDYEATLYGAVASDPDPSAYVNLLKSSSEQHQWYPKQPKPATDWEARVDEMLAELSRERDGARRRAVFRDIQVLFAENSPVVPVVARHIASGVNARVGNYRPSPIVPYSMWNAEELFVRK